MESKILVIPDMQVKPETDITFVRAVGRLLMDELPDTVVVLGDLWDMPSLSKHEPPGSKNMEGRRVLSDISAGKEAVNALLGELDSYNSARAAQKKRQYRPNLVFCMGNHEDRVGRLAREDARFSGFERIIPSFLKKRGFFVSPFKSVIEISGVHYSHYFENAHSNSSITRAHLLLAKRHVSTTAGHRQGLDFAVSETEVNGHLLYGLIAGSCYVDRNHYKSDLTNTHWAGVVIKHNCRNGCYDPEFVSIKSIINKYT